MSNNFGLKTNTLSIFAKTDGTNENIKVIDIPIDSLEHYKNHPFKLYTGQRFNDMVESIKENGLYSPIIVRPLDMESNTYEILSGHNRYECSKVAGFETIPCIVKKNLTEDDAYLIVTESNLLQRSFADLTHSEKAITLSTHYEILKKRGKQKDLINEIENMIFTADKPLNDGKNEDYSPVGNLSTSMDKTGDNYGLSKNTVARYLRINKLYKHFKDMVDSDELSIRAGVILSFIPEQSQLLIANYIDENKLKIDIKKAERLRELSQKQILTEKSIEEIFLGQENKKKPKTSSILKIKVKRYERFFCGKETQSEIEETLEKALEFYFEHKTSLEQNISEETKQDTIELENNGITEIAEYLDENYTDETNNEDLDDFDLFAETGQE